MAEEAGIIDLQQLLTERDRTVFASAGYGQRVGFGARPAIIVIDVNQAFVGLRAPILESIETWPQSTGEEAWEVVDRLVDLLPLARRLGVPVIYTTNLSGPVGAASRSRRRLPKRREQLPPDQVEEGRRIVAEIAPQPGDLVLEKPHASAFAETPLLSILNGMSIDTVILTGGTVSGCVRATAVDAAAANFHVSVVEDGSFDRGQASRLISLFDLNAKYADVVDMNEVTSYLSSLGGSPTERPEGKAHA